MNMDCPPWRSPQPNRPTSPRLGAWRGLRLLSLLSLFLTGYSILANGSAQASKLGEFQIREPLGVAWTEEWLDREVEIDPGQQAVKAGSLAVVTSQGVACPAQFYRPGAVQPLPEEAQLDGRQTLRVLFQASLPKNSVTRFTIEEKRESFQPRLRARQENGRIILGNGFYTVWLDPATPLPLNGIAGGEETNSLGQFSWPAGVVAAGVQDEWLERGPARALLRRAFRFQNPAHRYTLLLDFRANDPWIDIAEEYSLGLGSAIELDLTGMRADTVYHPYAYNARTFKPGGPEEDSTLQPPQHPIATLGPVWRDIWFNGGPYAFVYRSGAAHGLGFAAVRGSLWTAAEGVSKVSQNLEIHGDKETPGRVRLRLPTDGGSRRWAIIAGPPEMRKPMGRLVRSRADIPLDRVLREWVLEWPSDAARIDYSFAHNWIGPYNRHALNPTTFPRNVRKFLDGLFAQGRKPVKSRDLAFLAYVFTDPNYWPGPERNWGNVGNPNFHTDMYNVPLKIGLLMPDHPHAGQWVRYGLEETRRNLMRDSFPGGAWAESLSYSAFFFHIVENARKIREAGVADPFRDWPRFKEVAHYLAALHTPVDPRYGTRQKAPIGDTSPGHFLEELRAMADLYRGLDDRLARQLARFPEPWEQALDISSRAFPGFGAMLRGNAYHDQHESFVTLKAGRARNHYQGDELSFHFASLGAPLAIDYACHYSPRPWSASMHNRPDMAGLRPVAVGQPRAFAPSEWADVFVADERTWTISHVPMLPHETIKPGWEYPTTILPKETPWLFRRYVLLVKHDPARSRLADYLVIRDEIDSPQPVWENFHLLARSIQEKAPGEYFFPGQLGVDTTAHVFGPPPGAVEKRHWGWKGSSNQRRSLKGAEYEQKLMGELIPENFQSGTWDAEKDGERGQWLRIQGPAGRSSWLMALIPSRNGEEAPAVVKLNATTVRVSLGSESETIHLGSEGQFQAAIEKENGRQVLLGPGQVKPWSQLEFGASTIDTERGKDEP